MIRIFIAAILLASAVAGAANADESPEIRAAHLLSAAREAAGGAAWDKVRTIHLTGALAIDGMSAEREAWAEPATGRYSAITADGPQGGRFGFDGKMSWAAELDGAAHPPEAAQKSSLAAESYWLSLGWLRQPHAPLTVAWAREEKQSGRLYDIIHVSSGGDVFDLWLDQKNHLPSRFVIPRDGGVMTIRLSQWRAMTAGVSVPTYADISGGKDGHAIQTILNVTVNSASDAGHLTTPTAPAVDYVFHGEAVTAETPMKMLNGRIFITVNSGKTRLLMKFATGDTTRIDKAAANRLGLTAQNGAATASVRIPDFKIAGILFRHTVMPLADLAPLSEQNGVQIDGVIGSDFAKRLIVELDYQGRRVVFLRPDGFVPPPDAVPFDLTLDNGVPLIAGRLDGIPVRYALDSGRAYAAAVGTDFVTAHQLDQRWKSPKIAVDWQDDAIVNGRLARAGSLELGVLGLPQPLVDIGLAPRAGDVGLGSDVLRRFDIILNYPAGKAYLQPNSAQTQPYAYDHSGLWINQTKDGLMIVNVQTGSPGERATLLAGDRLEAISGDKASDVGLSDIRQRLMAEPGSAVGIGIRRNSEVRNVRLVLGDPLATPWEKEPK